jgi:hypothetical protein
MDRSDRHRQSARRQLEARDFAMDPYGVTVLQSLPRALAAWLLLDAAKGILVRRS